ncbi:MAG: hypothetical protein B7Y56_03295 [Gallionellales bacterium 35-53-114]|jgi:hypothetical protein|nr:MAG: hypothetical protein B7Y56_03295 [Gallionellales bacterium 35-53-114]OYZ65130.1 MAG: hypothetical protein B7Y04_00455 [Gallionellales bacterium 24-53-125]OZB08038.1 MAG: hypothetical protein B7X61_10905 [Gallionellales bacterium 39-52-133]HQS59941.1 hypothetical protein [Gallionellaceae bacterium]HQS76677.1 hypothetical protein [Gallionellaceae bacterium]
MTPPFVPIERLRHFSADGQVYRAFNHLIAASMGRLLLVPLHLVSGPWHLSTGKPAVIHGCPVPWEEVHAVLDYPVNLLVDGLEIEIAFSHLFDLNIFWPVTYVHEWTADHISPMVKGEEKVIRLVHQSGLRYAVVPE